MTLSENTVSNAWHLRSTLLTTENEEAKLRCIMFAHNIIYGIVLMRYFLFAPTED